MKCAELTSGGWESMPRRANCDATLTDALSINKQENSGSAAATFGENTEGSQKVVKFNNSHQSGNSGRGSIGDGQFNSKPVRKRIENTAKPRAQTEPK